MLQVTWIKKFKSGEFIDLHRVDLSKVDTFGVYLIWHGGQTPRVVRVGQGDIADRLECHRTDPRVQAYRDEGLYVTWAAVPEVLVDGVERYLAEEWPPLVGDRWPNVRPLEVNTPFAA